MVAQAALQADIEPDGGDVDPFSRSFLADPYPGLSRLQELGPLVWLQQYGVWCTARFAETHAVATDWETYCSGAGVGLANYRTEKPWRPPSLLLEADPPDHTRRRAVIGRVLSPINLRKLRAGFEAEAEKVVDRILDAGTVDGFDDVAKAYVLKVFPDAVGIGPDGRDNLLAYGSMVFNSFGPHNDIFRESVEDAEPVIDWIMLRCSRAELDPNGLGELVYKAADAGEVSHDEATVLVRSFLSAGVDTTVDLVGNALYCFAAHPEEWAKLRRDPTRARSAIEEVLRFESPFQAFFRTTTREVELAGTVLPESQKVLVFIGGANRDPRQWQDPDRFDLDRRTAGHLGFGAGIHGCVGQMISRLETEVLLTELAKRVERISLEGEGERRIHNTLRGFTRLPISLHS